MTKVTMNWASVEDYIEAKKIAEANNLDVKNPYDVEKVLKAQGFDVFMGDLKPWLTSSNKVVELDLELGATVKPEEAQA